MNQLACPDCGGSGEIANIPDWVPGQILTPCETCQGQGWVSPEPPEEPGVDLWP